MSKVTSVNRNRVLWCCEDRGITTSELADVLKVPASKLAAILEGNEEFSVSQLKKIAVFFNKGLLFFLESEPVDENRLRTAGFRTLSNEHPNLDPKLKSLIERVERQRQVFLGLLETNEDGASRDFKPPLLTGLGISDAASTIRNWLKLGNQFDFGGYRSAIEKQGILVFRSNGFAGK